MKLLLTVLAKISHCRWGGLSLFFSFFWGRSLPGLVPGSLNSPCTGGAQGASPWWESRRRVDSSIALSALGVFATLLSPRNDIIAHLCPSSLELPKSVS